MTERNHALEYRDSTARSYEYEFDRLMRPYILRTLKAHFLQSGPALELGCYRGDFTKLLARTFDDLTVVEAVDDLINETRSGVESDVKFFHSTIEKFNPDGRKFSNIFLIHTLEHLDDAVGVLRRIGDWLTEAGRLFIVVPNAEAASRQIAVHMGLISHPEAVLESERNHGHRRTYALDMLLKDIREAGLKTHVHGGIMFKPYANMQFDRMLENGIVTLDYLEGCYQLGFQYPTLCASIYAVVGLPNAKC